MPAVPAPTPRVHGPSLVVALTIMLVGTLYPPLMLNSSGKADHVLATALFWAMSAGFVRGVGFVPRHLAWRWLFSGWSCAAALGLAGAWKLLH
jgi:predicted membrane protein